MPPSTACPIQAAGDRTQWPRHHKHKKSWRIPTTRQHAVAQSLHHKTERAALRALTKPGRQQKLRPLLHEERSSCCITGIRPDALAREQAERHGASEDLRPHGQGQQAQGQQKAAPSLPLCWCQHLGRTSSPVKAVSHPQDGHHHHRREGLQRKLQCLMKAQHGQRSYRPW